MNPIQHAYMWYKYDTGILTKSMINLQNECGLSAHEFENIKKYVYSMTGKPTIRMRQDTKSDYDFLVHAFAKIFKC